MTTARQEKPSVPTPDAGEVYQHHLSQMSRPMRVAVERRVAELVAECERLTARADDLRTADDAQGWLEGGGHDDRPHPDPRKQAMRDEQDALLEAIAADRAVAMMEPRRHGSPTLEAALPATPPRPRLVRWRCPLRLRVRMCMGWVRGGLALRSHGPFTSSGSIPVGRRSTGSILTAIGDGSQTASTRASAATGSAPPPKPPASRSALFRRTG